MSENLKPVLWQAASMATPGEEVVLCEMDAARRIVRAYEGESGHFVAVSAESTLERAVERAKLVLRGDRDTLADARVMTVLAAHLVALAEPQTPTRFVAVPLKGA